MYCPERMAHDLRGGILFRLSGRQAGVRGEEAEMRLRELSDEFGFWARRTTAAPLH
jgi:hypothetical protein